MKTNALESQFKNIWNDKTLLKSIIIGLLFLCFSLSINYFASNYAEESVSDPVTDIILSNVPVMDVDGFIIILALALLSIAVVYSVCRPKTIPFLIKSGALFILIRSIFISLTHIGPFATQLTVTVNPIVSLGLGNGGDLFFSGHTGLPFLASLTFWENKTLRYVFLAGSFILGTCVLLGHFHYSIDVFGAFFITYTIYHLSTKFFSRDWKRFNS